ncbi:hypothetical protein Y592_03965 [Thermosipho sp. 1070]|nr:hypothetical protein Y592_03965 [Thermosipho sp. 1070]
MDKITYKVFVKIKTIPLGIVFLIGKTVELIIFLLLI